MKYFTSSKMDNKNTQVVVLKSNNSATWKIQIKMQLIALELFNIVDGNETVPDDETSANYKTFLWFKAEPTMLE